MVVSSLPEMPLPILQEGGPEEFDEIARSYLTSAEVLWKSERETQSTHFVAPSAFCLGLRLELFLKARLLERGCDHQTLRKEFGHGLYQMWMLPELAEMRVWSQGYAEDCVKAKKSAVPDPSKFTVDWTVEYLGKLYGQETFYALRYPKGRNQVPYVQPLLWVLYDLLDDPRWCLSCR